MENNVIMINVNEIPNEIVAVWLSDLFKSQIYEGQSNAEIWGHYEEAENEKEYIKIMIQAYNEVQKFWGKYGDYIEEKQVIK